MPYEAITIRPGMMLNIYHDPLMEKNLEGKARIFRHYRSKPVHKKTETLQFWLEEWGVRFAGQTGPSLATREICCWAPIL